MALHATVDRLRRDLRAMPPNERRQVLVQLSTLTRQELGGGGAQEEPPAAAAAAPSSTSPLQLLCGPRRGLVASAAVLLLLGLASMLRATDSDGACHHYGREPLREFVPPRPLPLEASSSSSSSCVCPTADGGGSSGSSGGGSSSSSIVIGGGSSAVADGFRRPGGEYPRHSAFEHPRGALQRLRARDGASAARNTSDFPLLLCIGQGKTATKSLNKAFVMLGLQTAHFYGAGVYGLLFDNAAEKAGHPFLFNVNEAKHVDAVLDTPVVDFYNEILLAYPNARVILTVRAVKSWLKSQQKFYCCFARGCHRWLAPWRRGSNLVYGTECPTKEQAVKRYVQHNRNVYDNVPHDRLLVMDIPGGDGWEKLVPFLNSFMPRRIPMPPSNFTFPSRH